MVVCSEAMKDLIYHDLFLLLQRRDILRPSHLRHSSFIARSHLSHSFYESSVNNQFHSFALYTEFSLPFLFGSVVIRQLSVSAFLKLVQPGPEEHSFAIAFLIVTALAFTLYT